MATSLSLERNLMPETVKTEHPHIVRLEGVCGGEPLIDGLRVSVRHVVTLHQRGEPIRDIAESLNITEAQVFHALSYFFDHRDEILALIDQEEQLRISKLAGEQCEDAEFLSR
jgi:uncharacterized protein (DUF433 family)